MSKWQNEQRPYKFEIAGQSLPSRVEVYGARAEGERPHLILEDRSDNQGLSVTSDEGRTHCIGSISKGMNIEPHEANWYIRNGHGEIRAVEVGQETKTVPHPEFAALARSGDLNRYDLEKAKKYFPDEKVTELRTTVRERDPEPGQMQALKSAFESKPLEQQRETPLEQKRETPQAQDQRSPKGAEEYDLSQERMVHRSR